MNAYESRCSKDITRWLGIKKHNRKLPTQVLKRRISDWIHCSKYSNLHCVLHFKCLITECRNVIHLSVKDTVQNSNRCFSHTYTVGYNSVIWYQSTKYIHILCFIFKKIKQMFSVDWTTFLWEYFAFCVAISSSFSVFNTVRRYIVRYCKIVSTNKSHLYNFSLRVICVCIYTVYVCLCACIDTDIDLYISFSFIFF